MSSTPLVPQKLEPQSPREMLISWNTGENYAVPYLELRFHCPCAACVDEHTGKRTLKREALDPDVRVTGLQIVGRYGLHFQWSDGHSTGMMHFDRLHDLCVGFGKKI